MGEWIFLLVCIVIIFFTNNYLKRFKTTKTEIILNAIFMPLVLGMFVWVLIENFSYRSLVVTSVLILTGSFSFYKTYKKFKRDNPDPKNLF